MLTTILVPAVVAFVLALAVVPLCRLGAMRLGYMAQPREDRWHGRPVALFGGVAVALVTFACAAAFRIGHESLVLVLTAATMFGVGLTDDVLSLKPATKLVAQIALASVLLFFGFRLNWLHSATLDTILTLFWIVGLTNAFNLLDNMDGLCAGIALIAGAALLIDLVPGSAGTAAATHARYLAILMGATGGFLVYNIYPASIFMGDSGSLLLGFSFAALTVTASREAPGRSDILSIVAAPVLVLLIPIFDTTLVTFSRWVSGRRASQGGRDHSSHRLVAIGLSERRAVAFLWLLAAIGGGLGVALDYFRQSWSTLAIAFGFAIGMVLFAAYLAGIRVYDNDDTRVQRGTFTPILVEFMYKRRVAEVLLDFCLVTLCYYTAYRLRFEDPEEFAKNFATFQTSLPVILAAQMISFFAVGVYRGVWRHFGMPDAIVVARGVFFGGVSAQLFILYGYRFFAYSRTVFAIYALLLLLAVTLSRASFRLLGDVVRRQRKSGDRAVVYGAGDAAALAIRELLSRDDRLRILGFIDDDPRKRGSRALGYPVLGGLSELTVLMKAASVDAVVISARHLTPERLQNLEALCTEYQVQLSRLRVGIDTIIDLAETAPARATIHAIKQS